MRQETAFFTVCTLGIMLVLVLFGGCCYIVPQYKVWEQGLQGQAELAHAEYSRKVATLEAVQKMESAKSLAEAEVIRAEGVARANKIIGSSLQGNEGYLRYLWILGMQTNQMQVVYVPTECNLPILEANRFLEYKK